MASVRVAVRVRPMNRREKDLTAKCIIKMDATKTSITNLKIPDGIGADSTRDRTKTFTYDFSYDSTDCKSSSFVSQEKVFKDLGSDVLRAAFEGYNACVFAYGQTGSGKSYTMMGNPGDAGLIPRFCEGLFSRIAAATRWDEASFRTEVSYLEIYNERVRDLLRRKSSQTYNLRVREHPKDGPYVEDLSKHLVQNYSDVEELMEAGNINRTTASTDMNDVSSRSHAIFTINFTQAKFDAEMPSETVSKIHLVDLAGSERADATGATGVRLKEGGNINKSLVTLGNVISALADMTQDGVNTNLRRKAVFVPYRDSVLTWLLKDSLGGNSKTIMVATVSPADVNYGETLSTLRYANRAKNIINKPTINEDGNVRLIRELRDEIVRLRALLIQGNQIALLDSPTALSMEEKLHQNEARVLELTKEWTNKWNETQNILKEETLALRKEGIGVVLDSELPHLIGIDDDLLSTGIILYHLKEGRTYVGREDASTQHDIILHGLDLESEHCVFENQNGKVTLVPLGGAQCSVNGVQLRESSQLNQGAVILLGRTNMFRFNHPKEAAKLREKRKSGLLSTFSLSMTDLSKSCDSLSTVMLYNPGLEFERQQREELEKLELKRRLINEMEEKHQSEKAELERLQLEVESQRKESEEVQQRILHQEESLRRRSQDIESRLRDFLAEKERFEEERRSEVHVGKPLQEEEEEEEEEAEQRRQQEAAEQTEIYRELERLKREREEQKVRLEAERRRLEEQEQEQLSLVGRLEEQLREKREAAASLLTREDAGRLEEERRALAEIREALLRAKEAAERPDVEDAGEEARAAQARYMDFKEAQVKELGQLEEGLRQQRGRLEKEVAGERGALLRLTRGLKERRQRLKEAQDRGAQDATAACQEEQLVKQAEQRLQFKERQLAGVAGGLLPALAEEKQRAEEVLERGGGRPPGLDNTLFQVEKELEDKEEKLHLHWHGAQQLQQLQETYEFTANVARQEEKVRRKETEILEAQEKQQREAMEQAVARLERRRAALEQRRGAEERELARQGPEGGLPVGASRSYSNFDPPQDGEERCLNLSLSRVEQEIQKLRRRLSGGGGGGGGDNRTRGVGQEEEKTPLSDDRINAYIEEEVQRRLRQINLLNGGNSDLSLSCDSLQEEEEEEACDCSSVRLPDQDDEKLQIINPRRLKYERACGLRSSLPPPAPILEAKSALRIQENMSEKPDYNLLKIHGEEKVEYAAKVLSEKEEVPYKEGGQNDGRPRGASIPPGEVGRDVCELEHEMCGTSGNPDANGNDENENIARERRTDSACCAPDDEDKQVEGAAGKQQTCDPETEKDAELSNDHPSKLQNFANGWFNFNRESKESVNGPMKREKDTETDQSAANRSFSLGYFTGKLYDACKDAGRKLQGTRDIIQNVGVGDAKVVLSQYVAMMSQELPLIHQTRLQPEPEPRNLAGDEVALGDPSKDSALRLPQNWAASSIPGVAGCPEGSVSSLRGACPEVFRQTLVRFPPALSRLQSLSSGELLEKLESLSPGAKANEPASVFWLQTAGVKRPIPNPGCLLLSGKDIVVLSSGTDSGDTVEIRHCVDLLEIKTVQIGLAGQHVRLLGSSGEPVLVVFTHSKELTQEFCSALLKLLSPERLPEGPGDHPLLSGDLAALSLDWTSSVPDIVLDGGLVVGCRFKRVLADLLYIVHGNMEGPGSPSLAHVRPLLYASVEVETSGGAVSQFLLTDTHVALLREDAVFHPAPRGSSLVPVRPQFLGLELRRRSDIGCLVARTAGNCFVVEITFATRRPTRESGRRSADVSSVSDRGRRSDSWNLTFGCTSEAVIAINHLST
ncbi:LOW QUALITY PROTEIN: kinesin-like protein KIF16B [Pseudoliparis swirei]|uniref:LOW QUALITY PROTEIN: kinesin-like protein KIF16B n=1 Tax=Pseudoliparis swirei TaxID=2059687 RepID=UPI0024BDC1E0|nr:LOW QUALITY PROTEIN: kinesin-like protein KIF16B [Pseudoliparis swirei]